MSIAGHNIIYFIDQRHKSVDFSANVIFTIKFCGEEDYEVFELTTAK
jgi:hypothetical protein